uniref:Uncharacterized protein n=1 Tax=Glossina brevipalpis TaxID=37001 RepID=A0A1A9WKI3_9MUSC
MQRSIYTLSKSNWNNFENVKNKPRSSSYIMQNKNPNRNTGEWCTNHQSIRKRIKKKKINTQMVSNKKQNITPNVTKQTTQIKSNTKLRNKKVNTKDFIKENIANVTKKPFQKKDNSEMSIHSLDQFKTKNFIKENIENVAKISSLIREKSKISIHSTHRLHKSECKRRKKINDDQNQKKQLRLENPIYTSTDRHLLLGSKSQSVLASSPSVRRLRTFGTPKGLHQCYKNEWSHFRENTPEDSSTSEESPPSTYINENIETWIGAQNAKEQNEKWLLHGNTTCSLSGLNLRNRNILTSRSSSIMRGRKLPHADPISLYEYYKKEWNYFRNQIPGERKQMQWHRNLLNQ